MTGRRFITKADFQLFLSKLLKGHKVIAPAKNGSGHVYKQISEAKEADFEFQNTMYSPKEFFYPHKETLFDFNGAVSVPNITEKRAIVGIRPCDMNALLVLDKIFMEDYYYRTRRENTVYLAFNCTEACENCFCCYDNFHLLREGSYDLAFTPAEGGYVVEIGSKKGEKLIDAKLFRDTDKKPIRNLVCKTHLSKDQISKMRANASHAVWKENAKKCLSCTACTVSCPTCLCFDIEDIPNIELNGGKRIRRNSSCQLKDFTRVAGNFHFRESREGRLKHRVYHKWVYHPDQYGEFLCVGCGRCITNCPTGISMVEMVNKL
ncbi:MAG: 4Fe-4S dicluster domain-containing protein [archaeon]